MDLIRVGRGGEYDQNVYETFKEVIQFLNRKYDLKIYDQS